MQKLFKQTQMVRIFFTNIINKSGEIVKECLTGGFLHAVSHKFSVPYHFLFREQVALHAALRTELTVSDGHLSDGKKSMPVLLASL